MSNTSIRIVIAQRGWVFVGRYAKEDLEVVLRDAYTIHRWGTPGEGLGKLTAGPTSATQLHKSGTIRLHPLQVIATMDCDPKGWAKQFPEVR